MELIGRGDAPRLTNGRTDLEMEYKLTDPVLTSVPRPSSLPAEGLVDNVCSLCH